MRADDSDEGLVQAARRGNQEAFAALLARHRPLLLALCRRTLGDGALAEDAAQEAALQALLRLDSLRQAARFGPWLAGIGLNVCRMWLRARSRECRPRVAPDAGGMAREPAGRHTDPAAQSEAADLAARVRRAVADLPGGQRAAVQLFYLSGLSYTETAAELGVEVGTVRTRLYKARGTLRHHLREIREEERMATAGNRKEYRCSFCGKGQEEVRRLIAGPGSVYICDECVDLCNKILDPDVPAEKGPQPSAR